MADKINVAMDRAVHAEAVRLSGITPKQPLYDYITEAIKDKNIRESKKKDKK